ncbi:hypothetical protein MRX96_012997 [Rhipicephalus microplus]
MWRWPKGKKMGATPPVFAGPGLNETACRGWLAGAERGTRAHASRVGGAVGRPPRGGRRSMRAAPVRPPATRNVVCEPQWHAGSARHRHAAQEDRAPHETTPRAAAATPRRCRPRRPGHAEAALREHDMSATQDQGDLTVYVCVFRLSLSFACLSSVRALSYICSNYDATIFPLAIHDNEGHLGLMTLPPKNSFLPTSRNYKTKGRTASLRHRGGESYLHGSLDSAA